MMGALVLYTIGTSRALVRADASTSISTSEALVHADACTSISSCLVLLGAPTSHNFDIEGFWYAKVHRSI